MGSSRSFYDRYWAPAQAPPDLDPLTEERVRRFLAAADQCHFILDLGCGNGRGTQLLTRGGKKVVALDISEEALKRASRADGAFSHVQADCEAGLPFTPECFDAVYCAEVVEHLMDPTAMLRECHRVLKPGGTLCISTPYHGRLKNVGIAALAFEKHFDPAGPHIRFFTLKSLTKLLEGNGFRVRDTYCFGRFWPVWMNMMVLARSA